MSDVNEKVEQYRQKLLKSERDRIVKRLVKVLLPSGGVEIVSADNKRCYKLIVQKNADGVQEVLIDDR